jgi:hypothetical protein
VAPVEIDGQVTQVYTDGDTVRIARTDGRAWTVRTAAGPTGAVTAAITTGDALYLVAGQTLWRADLAALR